MTAGWGAVEGYLQFDVKISSRQEGDLFGDNGTAPCACGTRSDSVYIVDRNMRLSFGIRWVYSSCGVLSVSVLSAVIQSKHRVVVAVESGMTDADRARASKRWELNTVLIVNNNNRTTVGLANNTGQTLGRDPPMLSLPRVASLDFACI